jgi:serine/threonine protein phosphatase PrpC
MMALNCHACGAPIEEDDNFCGECGVLIQHARLKFPIESEDGLRSMEGVNLSALSHPGRRKKQNQDAFMVLETSSESVMVLADGVSTSQMPHLASYAACEAWMKAMLSGENHEARCEHAKKAVAEIAWDSENILPPSSCAFLACSISNLKKGSGYQVSWSWIGDTRLFYIPHNGRPSLMTRDDETDGVLERCLGRDAMDEMHHEQAVFPSRGWLLGCSDGFWRYDGEGLLSAFMLRAHKNTMDALKSLMDFALKQGGVDNTTLTCIRLP